MASSLITNEYLPQLQAAETRNKNIFPQRARLSQSLQRMPSSSRPVTAHMRCLLRMCSPQAVFVLASHSVQAHQRLSKPHMHKWSASQGLCPQSAIRTFGVLLLHLPKALPSSCPFLSVSFPPRTLDVARYAFGYAKEKLHDANGQSAESLMTIQGYPPRSHPEVILQPDCMTSGLHLQQKKK